MSPNESSFGDATYLVEEVSSIIFKLIFRRKDITIRVE